MISIMVSNKQNLHGLVFPLLGSCLCLLLLFQNCSDVKLMPPNSSFVDPSITDPLNLIHQVSAGGGFACAIVGENRTAKCWGDNSAGQLGNNSTQPSSVPIDVLNLENINQLITNLSFSTLEATHSYSCALLSSGRVSCWGVKIADYAPGPNIYLSNSLVPFDMGINNIVKIAGGLVFACALQNDGLVKCWGSMEGINFAQSPVLVPALHHIQNISAGQGHMCVLTQAGAIQCWGANFWGQVGNGNINNPISTPYTVPGITNIKQIATGGLYTCVLSNAGSIKCWGENSAGQLGNNGAGQVSGGIVYSAVPVDVIGITDAIQISAGSAHTCALFSTGKVKCWGSNFYGELGIGTNTYSSIPVEVVDLENVVEISAGANMTCARLNDGTLKCWGKNNFGQLGNNTTLNSNLPVSVSL